MTLYQLWDPTVQFQTRSGKNLVNGTVEVTYLDRTQLAPVYDFDGKAIQNPVTLDENGRAAVYVEVDKQYTIHVYDQNRQLVYTQNICEYPKDTAITVPTIESTESISATLAGNTYTLDVKEDYIKKFGSNICVIQYGDTSKTLTDLGQYDTVLMQMNSKTFYLTELTDSNAHFMSCYQVAGSDCIETCDYDGSAWTDVSTVNFDSNVLVVTEGDTDVTYDQFSKYDAVLLKSTDGMLKGAMTYLHAGYAEFTVFTLKAGTRLAAEQTTVKVTFKSHTWSTSTSVIDKAISVIPYSDSTVTYSSVLFLIKSGGTCALRLANGSFAYLVDYDAVSIKFTWCRHIQGATEYYTLDSSNTWAMTTVSDVTAGTGIDISTDSVISSTGLVASQEGQTPDYLGNVLKAGQNITVTKDGEQVRIDSTASGGGGLEVIEISSSTATAADNTWHKLTYAGDVTVTLSTDIASYGFQYDATSLSKVTISTDLAHWHISGCSDRGNGTIPVYVPAGKSLVCRVWQDYIFIAVLAGIDTNTNDSNSLQSALSILDANIARIGSRLTNSTSTVLNLMSSLIDLIGAQASGNATVTTNITNSSIEVVE